MSYFEDDKKGQRNQAFPQPLYYYPLSFACLCDISCDTCLENIGDMFGGGGFPAFCPYIPKPRKNRLNTGFSSIYAVSLKWS